MRPIFSPHHPFVILGAGYTGSFLYLLAKGYGYRTFATSRFPEQHVSFAVPEDRLYFDLENPHSWANIPYPANLIWCFPALPEEMAYSFAKEMHNKQCRFVLLGSTSAYPTGMDTMIDETALINLHRPRVKSEEDIRVNFGATVLRLAGLYGPGRNVLDWIRKGRIQNTGRYVNLIHIKDVAEICLAVCTQADTETNYIVSDGTPRQWSAICTIAHQRWHVSIPPPTETSNVGKRLSPNKILNTLNYHLKYPDLFSALDELESHPEGPES